MRLFQKPVLLTLHHRLLVGIGRIGLGDHALHRPVVVPVPKRPPNGSAKYGACLEYYAGVVPKTVQNGTIRKRLLRARIMAAMSDGVELQF